jgi:2-polyprenyl-6-methoxyphenol hydroxylase-like FAD-dependent oxidoreductase
VTGLRLSDGILACDLVVDALGRRSSLGQQRSAAETTDCGVVYYSRYFRLRSGQELPDGPWLLSPRGDLGYFGYASFPGDNGTFAGLLAVPPGDPDWKRLRDIDAFSAAVAEIPALASWTNPDLAEPITEVMPMAGLRNVPPPTEFVARGYVAVGDALAHTDPVLAHGLSFALIHARTLVTLLRDLDVDEVGAAFLAAERPAAQERFDFSSELDGQRLRMWRGEPVDFTRPDGDYALFSMAAAGAVAAVHPDVFRCFVRRIGLLDSTRVLDEDPAMQQLIATEFARLARSPRPAPGPARDAMVELVRRNSSS